MKQFHLTPASLLGGQFGRDAFGDIRIALVGFCPPPKNLKDYEVKALEEQYFLHVAPESSRIVEHGGLKMLSLQHVYGGPVSAATVEDLSYYGFTHILAYGLAGGFGTKELGMGDTYLVDRSLVADGTTPHYTSDKIVPADGRLVATIAELSANNPKLALTPVMAVTGDAIYREDDAMLSGFVSQGADVINLDSAHLYAASLINSENQVIRTIQCGVISDVVKPGTDGYSESTLQGILAGGAQGGANPLDGVAEIVRFYIETLAPALSQAG